MALSGPNLIHSPRITAHMMMNHQMINKVVQFWPSIEYLSFDDPSTLAYSCSRDCSHVSDAMLGNILNSTLAYSIKYDSELHHLSVQMGQLTLPFLQEK